MSGQSADRIELLTHGGVPVASSPPCLRDFSAPVSSRNATTMGKGARHTPSSDASRSQSGDREVQRQAAAEGKTVSRMFCIAKTERLTGPAGKASRTLTSSKLSIKTRSTANESELWHRNPYPYRPRQRSRLRPNYPRPPLLNFHR